MITIYKKGSFESAHLLKGHLRCGKLHGHSYFYEVWISDDERQLQPKWSFLLDFHTVKEYFDQFDHSDKVITESAEMIAIHAKLFFDKLISPSAKLKIRIWETATSYAESTNYEQNTI